MTTKHKSYLKFLRPILFMQILALLSFHTGTALADTFTISITAGGFSPTNLTIFVGDTVRWINNDTVPRSLGSNPLLIDDSDEYAPLIVGDIAPGNFFSHTFTLARQYGYDDDPNHNLYEGVITVLSRSTRLPDEPIFENITISGITEKSAEVAWTTQRFSYTQLLYGTLTNEYTFFTPVNDILTAKHWVRMENLSASTTYYIRTAGGFGLNQRFTSPELTFTTLIPIAPPPPLAPQVLPVPVHSTDSVTTTATVSYQSGVKEIVTPPTSVPRVQKFRFDNNLRVGSRGAEVRELQNILIQFNLLPTGNATGYFGSLTKRGLVAFQSVNKVPSTGFCGPLTRAVLNTPLDEGDN